MLGSEVENVLLALETGHARHHLGTGSFHLFGQEVIRVQKSSVTQNHRGLALAAGTTSAEIWCIDPGRFDGFKHALGCSDRHALLRAREFDVIWSIDRRSHEAFEIDDVRR